eukprot:scaffold1050_cov51-Attheya_sp.AAC.4
MVLLLSLQHYLLLCGTILKTSGFCVGSAIVSIVTLFKFCPVVAVDLRALVAIWISYNTLKYLSIVRILRLRGTCADTKAQDEDRYRRINEEAHANLAKKDPKFALPAPKSSLTVDLRDKGLDSVTIFIAGASLSSALTWKALFSGHFFAIAKLVGAMPRFLEELEADADRSGLLHYEIMRPTMLEFLAGKPYLVVQYWRSKGHVFKFAKSSAMKHSFVMMNFMRHLNSLKKKRGEILSPFGIYHELYTAKVEEVESVFTSIPKGFGLMGAFPEHVTPVSSSLGNASAFHRQQRP